MQRGRVHKLFMLMSILPMIPAAAQQQSVVCSSKAKPQKCPADTSNGVLLTQETSAHLCQQGKTWHYDPQGIHVSGGCSATFLVNPKHSNAFGEGGYRTYGTGVDAFHTNGHVGPSGGASQRGVDDAAPAPAPQTTGQPK